jgi:hypothetical protein
MGVGLTVFQQFRGINGVCFYVSNILKSTGKKVLINIIIKCTKTSRDLALLLTSTNELNITFGVYISTLLSSFYNFSRPLFYIT